MKTIEVLFTVGTRYIGSTVEETVEVEIPEDATEKEIEEILEQEYQDWMWNNIDGSWVIQD